MRANNHSSIFRDRFQPRRSGYLPWSKGGPPKLRSRSRVPQGRRSPRGQRGGREHEMPIKEVYLYDDTNQPLRKQGIRVELFEADTGLLLDAQLSDDLNPSPSGAASNDWGVRLNFPATLLQPL